MSTFMLINGSRLIMIHNQTVIALGMGDQSDFLCKNNK